MNCVEKIFSRRSIRKYKNESISDDIIQNILEAGRRSPSAANSQPWHFIVIRDQKAKEACSLGAYNLFTGDADFVVVGLYKPSEAMIEKLTLMDVTIALQNMVIAAWVQGVGSCWIGAWNDAKLRDTLNLPADSKIVGLVTFGIPDENPAQQPKKSLNEITHINKW
jgi:nitroreductase